MAARFKLTVQESDSSNLPPECRKADPRDAGSSRGGAIPSLDIKADFMRRWLGIATGIVVQILFAVTSYYNYVFLKGTPPRPGTVPWPGMPCWRSNSVSFTVCCCGPG